MRTYKKALTFVLLLLFLFSTGRYLIHLRDNAASDTSYEQARAMAADANIEERPAETSLSGPQKETGQAADAASSETVFAPAPVEKDVHMEALNKLDPFALRQVNPDVIGWILLPGTGIDYPVVQGEDNEYYLDLTWDKQSNASGSIFLECTNQADMTEFHTILYGHNMINKTMFAPLRDFTTVEFWQEHPYVYLITEAGVFRYEIYASYLAEVEGNTYRLGMQQENTKQRFIEYTLQQSVIDTGITPAATDRILTLSTCSGMGYSTRWVVHARLPMVKISG